MNGEIVDLFNDFGAIRKQDEQMNDDEAHLWKFKVDK